MNHIVRFLALSNVEQGLILEAFVRLLVARLGLWLLPLERLMAPSSSHKSRTTRNAPPSLEPERVLWSVRAASRRLPGNWSCLVQSLAAMALMNGRGYAARVRIGVIRRQDGSLNAHAWLECDGKALINPEVGSHFHPLPSMESRLP